jgi:hypothetical protein
LAHRNCVHTLWECDCFISIKASYNVDVATTIFAIWNIYHITGV